ncbi:cohesin domain-containing protein [Candidatus Neomarinimicrobiota bacterium]
MFLYRNRILMISIFSLSLAYAQTEWLRYEGNPVLVPGGLGESTTVGQASVVFTDSIYHMWYASTDHPEGWNPQIFYAFSYDGIDWTKRGEGPVVPLGPDPAWDSKRAHWPEVIVEDSLFRMWYSGRGPDLKWHIGYAVSADGITWEKYIHNPVLSDSGGNAFTEQGLVDPCILKIDDVYHMWYSGLGSGVPATASVHYATSLDGLNWDNYDGNPVLVWGAADEFDSEQCGVSQVLLIYGQFHMWYLAWDGIRQTIGYATSPDGINWTKWPENPIMTADPTSWEGENVAVDDVHYAPDGTLKMWYEGGGTFYSKSIGYATAQFAPYFPGDRFLSISRAVWVAGDTVHVPVLLSESNDVAGIDFTISYDTSLLTFSSIDTTSLTSGFLIASNETAPGTLAVALAAPYPLSLSTEAAVALMDFVISPDATVGISTPVRFLTAALADTSGSALELATQDGSVLVTWPGDLNFDGMISSGDAVVTLRICIGAHDPTPREFAMADRDSNGVVEVIDALCLLQTAVGLGCSMEGGDSELVVELISPQISGTRGSEVVIPIQLSLADQLAAGSLELALPPDLVTAISITPGDLLVEGYTAWNRDAGILRLGFLTAQGLPRAEGVLVNLHLTLGSDLDEHTLEISADRLFDARGRSMDLDIVLATDDGMHPVPGQYSLAPAYPNPFNPATTIRYELPAAVPVRLIVYDLLGREVTRLVEAAQSRGSYEVPWDGTDALGRSLTSGIYIARLLVPPTAGVTPEYSESIKLVLLK